jgi:hypothetical protein
MPFISPIGTTNNNQSNRMTVFNLTSVVLALLVGILAGLGQFLYVALLLGVIVGIFLIAKPKLAVWIVIISGLIISGIVELYLPQFQQIRWGISMLSIALIPLSIIFAGFNTPIALEKKMDPASKATLFLAIGLLASAFLTVLANPLPISTCLIGLKNYFQMFGLLATFATFRYTTDEAGSFINFLLLLGLIQLPFVLHQFLVLVPLRSTEAASEHQIVAVDIVAGTFGGDVMGGGRSSSLALLSATTITLVCAQWRAGQKSLLRTILFSLIFIAPMALNEAKLFIVLLPVALLILFQDKIIRNPVKAIVTGACVFGLMVSLLLAASMLPGAKSQHSQSLSDFVENFRAYNVGNVGYGDEILNRTTVYSFWWTENIGHGDYLKALFGHGLGATNAFSSLSAKTLANGRYKGYGIGLTSLSSLLWEIGVLGTVMVLAFFLQTYRLGGILAKSWQHNRHWPFIKTAQIGVLLVIINFLHNNYFVADINFQTFYMLLIGYLVVMSRKSPEQG